MLEWKKNINENSSELSKTQIILKMILVRKRDLIIFSPHIIELAEICQSMPVSNAWPERGASTVKRVKTRLRSSIKEDMLMTLMNISINGPKTGESEKITEKAVKHWQNQKERRKLPKNTTNLITEGAQNETVETVDSECQTDITGDNIRQMLREEVKVACKQMLLEDEYDEDGYESDANSDFEF